jgi:hypothetical protein
MFLRNIGDHLKIARCQNPEYHSPNFNSRGNVRSQKNSLEIRMKVTTKNRHLTVASGLSSFR